MAFNDAFNRVNNHGAPFERVVKLVQIDSSDVSSAMPMGMRAMMVGVDATVAMFAQNTVSIFLQAGIWHPIRPTHVFTTGTDSVGIWGGF